MQVAVNFSHRAPRGLVGNAVWNATASGDSARNILRDVFGVKSPNTVMKRASSLLAFFHWLQKHSQPSWPFDNENVSVYIGDFASDQRGITRGS